MTLKATLALATLALGLLPTTGMVAHAAAGAADTTQNTVASADRTAQVTVNPGELKFQTDKGKSEAIAPSFTFKTAKVSNGAQTGLTADAADNSLGISNMLGGSPWQINVHLGEFTGQNNKDHKLSGAVLNLTPQISKADLNATPASVKSITVTSGNDAVPLLVAAEDQDMGNVTTSLAGTTLNLPNAANYAETYTAKLTYTLTTGPQGAQTTPTPQPSTQH